MALIECSRCGKKISDTTDTCIHCGASTKPLNFDETSSFQNEQYGNESSNESTCLPDFDSFGDDCKTELEKEFLKTDVRAMKYRRRRAEIGQFFRIFCWIVSANFIISIFLTEVSSQIIGNTVYYKTLDKLSEYLFVALIVLALSCLIYAIVTPIVMKISVKRYVYMKKFQKWLREEKKIDYTPPLMKIKQKNIFDSIDLETFNL
ncbi:MAG: zinc ribbon domain-containing protein [Clostridia bacterium]|nr:zinc ribbon domain-containing protein [Clostridia bacterium]